MEQIMDQTIALISYVLDLIARKREHETAVTCTTNSAAPNDVVL